jgi:XRE family transcriptional regulator, regulator of sulfur utilization
MALLAQTCQGATKRTVVDHSGMPTRRPESQAERAHAFGARIRALRRERKLTQRQVAERVPMSPGNLSRLENGEHGPPSDEVIATLATVLEADTTELLKLAGRDVGGASFERQVLAELGRLRREIHAGFERLDESLRKR